MILIVLYRRATHLFPFSILLRLRGRVVECDVRLLCFVVEIRGLSSIRSNLINLGSAKIEPPLSFNCCVSISHHSAVYKILTSLVYELSCEYLIFTKYGLN